MLSLTLWMLWLFSLPDSCSFPEVGIASSRDRLWTYINIRMPVFSNGLQSQWIPFSLCAGIIHIGRSPFSGHYRAFLQELMRTLSRDSSLGLHPDQPVATYIR